jgi:hypothetical protein
MAVAATRDDAVAQLMHGDFGGLHGYHLQRDHGRVIAHRTQGRHGSLHCHRLDRLPDRGGVHLAHGDIDIHCGRVLQHPDHGRLGHLAFALEGGHLVLSVLPGQLHGLHLQLLRHLGGEAAVAHVADRRPVGDLAVRHG